MSPRRTLDGGARIVARGRAKGFPEAVIALAREVANPPPGYFPERGSIAKRQDGSVCRWEVYYRRPRPRIEPSPSA